MRLIEIELLHILPAHKEAIYALAKTEDESVFFSAGADKYVIEWSLSSLHAKAIAQMPATIYSLCLSEQNNNLLIGLRNGQLYQYHRNNNIVVNSTQLNGGIFALEIMEGYIIASTDSGYLYKLDEKLKPIKELRPTQKSGRALQFNTENRLLASGWSDGLIRIYNSDLKEIKILEGHKSSVFSLAWGEKNRLFSGGRDALLCEWNLDADNVLMVSVPAHWFAIYDLKTAGDYLFSASRDKTIRLWKQEPLSLITTIKSSEFFHSINKLLWLKSKNFLIAGGDDRKIGIWKVDF